MPAFTPNRNYPYSVPGDPADVPAALQALAEAVDTDAEALETAIVRRPVAKVRQTTLPYQVFPPDILTECVFDFVEVDTAGISSLSTLPTRLTPTSAGLWLVWGNITTPEATMRARDLRLQRNGVDTQGRHAFYFNIAGRRNAITAAGIVFMNGTTDYFTMVFEPDQAAENFIAYTKEFGCARLTTS